VSTVPETTLQDLVAGLAASRHAGGYRFKVPERVLRPGGVLSISDITVQRWPVTPAELLAGLTQLRVFGLRRTMAMTAGQIAAEARAAGLAEVQVRRCGERVIAPALRLTAQRLENTTAAPAGQRAAARLLLRQVNLLWRRQIIDYLLLRAIRP
jgi:hypothetical protein